MFQTKQNHLQFGKKHHVISFHLDSQHPQNEFKLDIINCQNDPLEHKIDKQQVKNRQNTHAFRQKLQNQKPNW